MYSEGFKRTSYITTNSSANFIVMLDAPVWCSLHAAFVAFGAFDLWRVEGVGTAVCDHGAGWSLGHAAHAAKRGVGQYHLHVHKRE